MYIFMSNLTLFRRSTIYILIELERLNRKKITVNQYQMSMLINMTYSQVSKRLVELKKMGFVNLEKNGRESRVSLTARGLKLAHAVKQMLECVAHAEKV